MNMPWNDKREIAALKVRVGRLEDLASLDRLVGAIDALNVTLNTRLLGIERKLTRIAVALETQDVPPTRIPTSYYLTISGPVAE